MGRWNRHNFVYDCYLILDYIVSGKPQTERAMEECTGIPRVRIRRMIEPVCLEKRSQEDFGHYMDASKKSTLFAGRYFLSLDENMIINYSLNEGFLNCAKLLGYLVKYIPKQPNKLRKRGPKLYVVKLTPQIDVTSYITPNMVDIGEDREELWTFCDKCNTYSNYTGVTKCRICGNKLEIGNSIEKQYRYV